MNPNKMKVEKILNDEILDFQADIYAFNVVSSGCTYKFHEVHDIITKAFMDHVIFYLRESINAMCFPFYL